MVELLVSIAVMAILLAIIVPSIQFAREASRRTICTGHLKQFGQAILQYESVHRMFPSGGAYGASAHVALLPFVDQADLFQKYDFVRRDSSKVRGVVIPLYLCPSDPAPASFDKPTETLAATSYSGNAGTGVLRDGYNGMFRHIGPGSPLLPEGPVRVQDVEDGLSNTVAMSEILHSDRTAARLRVNWHASQRYRVAQFDSFRAECEMLPASPAEHGVKGEIHVRGVPWTSGQMGQTMYVHTLPPNLPSCFNGTNVPTGIYTAASTHAAGVNLLFADGRVQLTSASIDRQIWRELGSRSSRTAVALFE